jgi:hypothetical protein
MPSHHLQPRINRIIDIRLALENQGRFARGIESAVAGLDCGGGLAQNGCQMLLMQHANALDDLVTALCEIGSGQAQPAVDEAGSPR